MQRKRRRLTYSTCFFPSNIFLLCNFIKSFPSSAEEKVEIGQTLSIRTHDHTHSLSLRFPKQTKNETQKDAEPFSKCWIIILYILCVSVRVGKRIIVIIIATITFRDGKREINGAREKERMLHCMLSESSSSPALLYRLLHRCCRRHRPSVPFGFGFWPTQICKIWLEVLGPFSIQRILCRLEPERHSLAHTHSCTRNHNNNSNVVADLPLCSEWMKKILSAKTVLTKENWTNRRVKWVKCTSIDFK